MAAAGLLTSESDRDAIDGDERRPLSNFRRGVCPVAMSCHCIPHAGDGFAIDGNEALHATLNNTTGLILAHHSYSWHGLPLGHGDGAGIERQCLRDK